MTTVRFKIQLSADRHEMVLALANAGYKVWVEEQKNDRSMTSNDYYVCVEMP